MNFFKLIQRPSQLRAVFRTLLSSHNQLDPVIHSRNVYYATNLTFGKDIKANYISKRFKKKRTRNPAESSEDNADDDDDNDDESIANENPLLVDDLLGSIDDGSQQMSIEIGSLRLDAFAKTAFGLTRAKVEELYYKGSIYVNGEVPTKKSQELFKGDEVDVIKQVNTEDTNLVDIRRAFILDMPDKTTEHGRVKLKIKRWMDLTVEPPKGKER